MTWLLCSKCEMVVAETALEVHRQLNHPKRHAGNLAALQQARAILQAKRAQRAVERQQLEASWAGAAR